MARQQRPPQIKKITITDRKTGKSLVRYQITVDTGINPQTGAGSRRGGGTPPRSKPATHWLRSPSRCQPKPSFRARP